jgi:hypothetical protein
VTRTGERTRAYRVLVGKHEGKKALGRPIGRWENKITKDLKSVGTAWIGFIWLRIRTSSELLLTR